MSIQKNVALSDYLIYMVDNSSRPDGKTGETVAVSIALDGGSFSIATNSTATEMAEGFYKIDFVQAEMNADSIAVRANSTNTDDWNDVLYPDEIEVLVTTVDTVVDGIVTDIAAVDSKIDIIDTNVDDIETLLTTVDGKVDVIDGNVDDIETLLTTVDGKVDTLDTNVDTLVTTFSPAYGAGTIEVTHDVAKGSDVDLTVLDAASSPVEDANIYIFLKTDYDAGNRSSSYYKGYSTSDVNGEWDSPVWLDAGTYTLVADGNGISQVMVQEFTVS